MTSLVAHVSLTLLAYVWIAWDAETAYIFDAFGRSFYWIWHESGKRWRYLLTYGWRLAVLASVILVGILFAWRFFTADPLQIDRAGRILTLTLMLAASLSLMPWIHLAARNRWLLGVRSAARQLTDLVERVTADDEFLHSLNPAPYETQQPWTAWHPSQDQYSSGLFPKEIVPVVYVCREAVRSVLLPIDWQTFLAWSIPKELRPPGSDLPFQGPFESSFRVKSIRNLRGCPGWCLVKTEMRSGVFDFAAT